MTVQSRIGSIQHGRAASFDLGSAAPAAQMWTNGQILSNALPYRLTVKPAPGVDAE
jgi:hypothetical protein